MPAQRPGTGALGGVSGPPGLRSPAVAAAARVGSPRFGVGECGDEIKSDPVHAPRTKEERQENEVERRRIKMSGSDRGVCMCM